MLRITSPGRILRAAAAVAVVWASPAWGTLPVVADPPIPITECATTIQPGKRAALRADVVCEARCSNDPAIACAGLDSLCPDGGTCLRETLQLGLGAHLSLGGHQLSMEHRSASAAPRRPTPTRRPVAAWSRDPGASSVRPADPSASLRAATTFVRKATR